MIEQIESLNFSEVLPPDWTHSTSTPPFRSFPTSNHKQLFVDITSPCRQQMISFMGDRYDLWLPPMVYRSVFAETYDRKRFLGTSPHWVSTEVTYMPWLPNGSCSIALGNIFTAISPNGEPIPDLVPHSLMEGISSFWNEGFNTDLVECMMGNPLMRHLLDNKSMNEEEEVNAYLERLNEGEGHDSEEEYDLLTAYLTAWESMSREEILDVVSRLLPDSPVN